MIEEGGGDWSAVPGGIQYEVKGSLRPIPTGEAFWRVAVTRPADVAERLARLVRAEGGKPVVMPLIRIEAPADSAPLARAAALLSRYDWLVFTSANAVDALLLARI